MKRMFVTALSILAASALLAGCSKMGVTGGFSPKESCVYIEADGSAQWASVESYEKENYTSEGLKESAGKKIGSFNSSLGKDASFENKEGSEKLPVAIVSASMKDGKAVLVLEYDTPGRLVEFARQTGDDTVTFTALDTGRVASMSSGMQDKAFQDAKGNAMAGDEALKDNQSLVVMAEGKGVIKTENAVNYVSDGCVLMDSYTVETPEDGTAYIIL